MARHTCLHLPGVTVPWRGRPPCLQPAAPAALQPAYLSALAASGLLTGPPAAVTSALHHTTDYLVYCLCHRQRPEVEELYSCLVSQHDNTRWHVGLQSCVLYDRSACSCDLCPAFVEEEECYVLQPANKSGRMCHLTAVTMRSSCSSRYDTVQDFHSCLISEHDKICKHADHQSCVLYITAFEVNHMMAYMTMLTVMCCVCL